MNTISFKEYMKRKKIYYMSSDITGKSKKYFYCPLYEACSVYQTFSYLTAICKLGRHSSMKKKPKMREFSKSKNIFLTFLVFSRLSYRDSTIKKTFVYTILSMPGLTSFFVSYFFW